MSPTLVMVHTIPGLVEAFATWCRVYLPEVDALHILDEPLLARIKQHGHAGPEDDDRLLDHVRVAANVGAAVALVTCSSASESVERIRDRAAIPVISADEAMAEEAVRRGHRIFVVATAATTLQPSERRLRLAAEQLGKPIEVSTRFVDEALAALLHGDAETHDRLVIEAVEGAAAGADVIVLAQATMARVLPLLADAPPRVPVLASPPLALMEVRRAILPGAVPTAPSQQEVPL